MININPYSTLIKNSGIGFKYVFIILPNMSYYFTNILEITTPLLSLDYINPKNKKRLDLIIKLHKIGKSNEKIVEMFKIKEIKSRNKNDNYSVEDIIMYLNNLKKREQRRKGLNVN